MWDHGNCGGRYTEVIPSLVSVQLRVRGSNNKQTSISLVFLAGYKSLEALAVEA